MAQRWHLAAANMKAASQAEPKLSHEQVALRAFSKWLTRGCPDGDGETDWYEALKELEHLQRQKDLGRHQESFARWPVPTIQQPAAWWAVYRKVDERDGIPERLSELAR